MRFTFWVGIIIGALVWVLTACNNGDKIKTNTTVAPDSSRYTRTVLAEGLEEPMEMAILPGNDVLFVERKGGVRLYKNATRELRTLVNFQVFSGIEDGLLGVVADPAFEKNNWLYFYYAVAGNTPVTRLSRFEFRNDSLLQSSERILLEIPTQRVYCCHSAGYLRFDRAGNLYISTGDNTNAEETEGYTPVDERPGRHLSDDQATAANTNDLRGKILRIQPQPDGTYTIPDGNLFKPGTPGARPEIYVMGARNPYRFSIDNEKGVLYFGDIGPDTHVESQDGEKLSFDEVNQVKTAGFFGWPYFLGNNEVFPKYNYATKQLEPGKDPLKPANNSPNNTGLKELPAAQPAMIWYGKSRSQHFPLVGSGGATLLAGPVYYSKYFKNAPYKLSEYYNGKLFIYEWIRGWIMAVSFDENGNYKSMEPFLQHWRFEAPVDIQLAADGAIYMLEYGTNWFSKNNNARLVRIEYAEGNRNPVPVITIDKQYGTAPFHVKITAVGTIDPDKGDSANLVYNWQIGGQRYTGIQLNHTFEKTGIHDVTLTVTDNKGSVGTATAKVYVGNTAPEVKITTTANRSFYWDGSRLDYKINVSDADEAINKDAIAIAFGFIPNGKDAAIALTSGQNPASMQFAKGQELIASLDCRSCHNTTEKSVGPEYKAIATRYAGKAGARQALIEKVIQGGSGNWGERAMSPHPDLAKEDAGIIVDYILSLAAANGKLPLQASLPLRAHIGKGTNGAYLLRATYKDGGTNGMPELVGVDQVILKYPLLQAEDFDEGNVHVVTVTTAFMAYVDNVKDNSFIGFRSIDLTGVKWVGVQLNARGAGGTIELRQGSKTGSLIGKLTVAGGDNQPKGWRELKIPVMGKPAQGDLYLVFRNDAANGNNLFDIDWLRFYN